MKFEQIPKMESKKSPEEVENEIYELIEDESVIELLGKERLMGLEEELAELETDEDFESFLLRIKKIITGVEEIKSKPFSGMVITKQVFRENAPDCCSKGFLKSIEEVINEAKEKKLKNIGNGLTAEVSVSKKHPGFCFKIIRTDAEGVENYKMFNDVVTEAYYLDELADFEVDGVRTPMPYCYEVHDEYHVLVMETLDAVSVDDLFCNRAKLPENFNEKEFYHSLEKYIEELHTEKKIHHFDLHPGNIMIDKKTGKARVIDFGKSDKEMLQDQEGFFYQKDQLRGIASQRTRDEERLKMLRNDMGNYLQNVKNLQK